MAISTTGLMTWEQFEQLPESVGKQELLQGELIELPPPKKRHTLVAQRIQYALFEFLKQRDGFQAAEAVHPEMGYRLSRHPDSWFVPDVSISHADQQGDEYCEGAPLLAVEVISPSNSAQHLLEKVSQYLTKGSVEVWVVSPSMRNVWVYRKIGATPFDTTLTTDLLPGLSIDLRALFAD